MREIKSHTALRGIAALLVVIYHYRILLPANINPDSYTSFFEKGYLWVYCFFMLSGFVLCYVYEQRPASSLSAAGNFLRARFARIYPLHLATLLAMSAIFLGFPLVTHNHFTPNWHTFVLNLFDVHAWVFPDAYDWNFPSWSISVEFAAYLLFPLICLGLVYARSLVTSLMMACFFPALFIGRDHWESTALLQGIPMFFAGVLIFLLPRPRQTWLQVPVIALLLISMHLGSLDAIPILGFATLIYLSQTDGGLAGWAARSNVLLALGAWSYSIYMLHIPVKLASEILLSGRVSPALLFAIDLTATLILGALSYRYFEVPAREYLRQRRRIAIPAA